MSPNEPLTDAPQQDAPDFDAHAAAIFAQTRAPEDVQAGQEEQAPVAEAAPVVPGAPTEDEPDDDDEALPLDRRFARAQQREQKLKAERETIAAERQRAIDQANGFKGNLAQEKARRAASEAERDQFKQQADDTNAAYNAIWEARIATTTDPQERAAWQEQYDFDRAKREVAADKAKIAFERSQAQEAVAGQRRWMAQEGERGLREYAVADIITGIQTDAQAAGMPVSELRDMLAHLNSQPVQLLARKLPPDDLMEWRASLADAAKQEVALRADAYRDKQATANRTEARQVYRAEQPVGQGGPPGGPDLSQYRESGDTLGMLQALYPQPQH